MMRPCSRRLGGWRDDGEKREDGGDEQQSTRRGGLAKVGRSLAHLAPSAGYDAMAWSASTGIGKRV